MKKESRKAICKEIFAKYCKTGRLFNSKDRFYQHNNNISFVLLCYATYAFTFSYIALWQHSSYHVSITFARNMIRYRGS